MKKRILLSVLVLLLFLSLAAQRQPLANSLLWRISGNGLGKPSYLYGTMHLTDKRIFQFSDSLYYVLENTEGYAAELELGLISESNSLGENINEKQAPLTSIVDATQLAPYQKKLETLFGKPLDSISVNELRAVQRQQTNSELKAGEMPTIVDLYLYNIAESIGKWVGGIEDLDDHRLYNSREAELIGMVASVTEEKKELRLQINAMLKNYQNQDLNAIYNLTNSTQNGSSIQLIQRNLKMVQKIDSLMKIRTVLFAVGVGHLPGDSGLIRLLQRRGFRVEPVFGKKKIAPQKYSYKVLQQKDWVVAQPSSGWYSIQMPQKPIAQYIGGIGSDSAYVVSDLINMCFYTTFSYAITPQAASQSDSLFNVIAANYATGGKIKSVKVLRADHASGREYFITRNDYQLRLQVYQIGTSVVVNFMNTFKWAELKTPKAERFFSSFRQLKAPPQPIPGEWTPYRFREHGFMADFPGTLQAVPAEANLDSIWKTTLYHANDSSLFAWVMVSETREGYYSNTDSGYFASMLAGFESNKGNELLQHEFTNIQGFPAMNFSFIHHGAERDYFFAARMVNRGNRRFYCYATADEVGDTTTIRAFLNSFRFIGFPQSPWDKQKLFDNELTTWAPVEPSNRNGGDYLAAFDSLAPTTLLYFKTSLTDYDWWESDSAFFRDQTNRYLGSDSLLNYEFHDHDGTYKSARFQVYIKGTHNLKQILLLLNGKQFYVIICFAPEEVLTSGNYLRWINETKPLSPEKSVYHLQSKAERILEDLENGDSTAFEKASLAFSNNTFTVANLPLLQESMLKLYRDFSVDAFCLHDRVINTVLRIDDGSTGSYIKQHYATLKGSREILKYPLLSVLLRLEDKAAFQDFVSLLEEQGLPAATNAGILLEPLLKNPEPVAGMLPLLLRLGQDSSFARLLPELLLKLIKQQLITKDQLETAKNRLLELAGELHTALQESATTYDGKAATLAELLGYFNDKETIRQLRELLKARQLNVKFAAALALLGNKQTVAGTELEKIAEDHFYRTDLYDSLLAKKQAGLFPRKYLSQEQFAQSVVYAFGSDDYYPAKVAFLGEQVQEYQGKQETFYLFLVEYQGDAESGVDSAQYLGIAGAYTPNEPYLSTSPQVVGINFKSPFDKRRLSALLREFLSEREAD